MQNSNPRVFALVGIVAMAVAALVMFAARQLGSATGSRGAGQLGDRRRRRGHHVRRLVGVAAFAFATALSGSVTGLMLAPVLFGAPALSVLILGLLALRVAPGRAEGVSIHREAQYQ
jgi:hypothetical protein